jgi:hypothetical protein
VGIWRQAAVAAALLVTAPAAHAAAEPYDFNGDGRQDLVAATSEGLVAVGTSRHGLRLRGTSLEGDGRQLASADFDGDGNADLATIVAEEVRVYLGSERGLAADRTATWTEPDTRIVSIAAADVDGDGYGDLAASTFGPDPRLVNSQPNTTVAVVRGGPGGLERERAARLDAYGLLMRFGDIDRDEVPDLIYTSPSGPIGICPGTGTAGSCYGFQNWGDPIESIAIGDVTGDPQGEVIVGTPRADGFGAVHVLEFKPNGLARAHTVDQTTKDVPGRERLRDVFGWSVEAGHVNGDRKEDVVVGNPGERGGGSVTVLLGARRGIGGRGARLIHQRSRAVPGTAEPNDFFGAALALLDHDGDGRGDLSVGAPDERNPRESEPSGRVTVLPGGARKRPFTLSLFTLSLPVTPGAAFGGDLGRR